MMGYLLSSQAPGLVLCAKPSDTGQRVPGSLAFALSSLLQPFDLFGVARFEGLVYARYAVVFSPYCRSISSFPCFHILSRSYLLRGTKYQLRTIDNAADCQPATADH